MYHDVRDGSSEWQIKPGPLPLYFPLYHRGTHRVDSALRPPFRKDVTACVAAAILPGGRRNCLVRLLQEASSVTPQMHVCVRLLDFLTYLERNFFGLIRRDCQRQSLYWSACVLWL